MKGHVEQFTAAELGEMIFDPLEYVVEPIIAAGSSTLIAGRPKCNKSWLALEIATAIASGTIACGDWRTGEPSDVLYFALEDNKRRLRRRLDLLRPKGELPARLSFKLAAPLIGNGFREDVERWVKSADRPRLVIVDTYSLILPNRQKPGYLSDYADSAAITQIANELNIAFLCVYHTRKSEADDALDAISGTTGIAGGFDSVLVLKRSPEGGFILEGRGRDIMPLELGLDFDADSAQWRALGDATTAFMGDERRAILDALGQLGEAGPKEIADRTGLTHDSVRQLLRKMVESGAIHKVSYGSYAPAHTGHSVHSNAQSVNGVNTVMGG